MGLVCVRANAQQQARQQKAGEEGDSEAACAMHNGSTIRRFGHGRKGRGAYCLIRYSPSGGIEGGGGRGGVLRWRRVTAQWT
jgi:hypothetical protein